jgi:holo-[acyl-carrier protein] synthase
MAVGIGVDIIEVERVERVIAKRGERFLERVFTPQEIAYCRTKKNAAHSFAARFAAKEAAFKALGTGWAKGVTWKDVEVVRIPPGAPKIRLRGRALRFAERKQIRQWHLSLSHLRDIAVAFVVADDRSSEERFQSSLPSLDD